METRKTVKFNLECADEKKLHTALKDEENFSGETKKMWADKLGFEYEVKGKGNRKVNHEND